jgi:hypothetical protein
MAHELSRSDIRQNAPQQFYTKFDTVKNKGGGYVVLSP